MTNNKFRTKITYIIIIIVLLIPLLLLGRPSSIQKVEEEGRQISGGGYLATLRQDEGVTDAQLGEIDPGSSTMKLATFGMRGVALALLWHKSLEAEKKFDWNNVVVTSKQIIMLEPRFVSIWDYHSWRLAYNASANQDDYRERYRWVIRGYEFLEDGVRYNTKAPFLYHKAGWTISQKIGIADEKVQYRQLFREDDEFHEAPHIGHPNGTPTIAERDNWLFGIPCYQTAEEIFLAVENKFLAQKEEGLLTEDDIKDYYDTGNKKESIGAISRPLFLSHSRMNRIHYADWYEQDGGFGEKAQNNWAIAQRIWDEFGDIEITTTIDDRKNPGNKRRIYLKEAADSQKAMDDLEAELITLLAPRTKNDLYVERWNTLTELQQATLVDSLEQFNLEHFVAIREYLDENRPDWKVELTELRDSLIEDPEELAAYLLPEPIRKGNRGMEQSDERDEFNLAQKAARAIEEVGSQATSVLVLTPQAIAGEIASYENQQRKEYQDYLARLEENPDLANDPDFKVVEPPTRNAPRAREINQLIEDEKPRFQLADMFCSLTNYVHYGDETEVEQTQEAINANEAKYIARKAFNEEGNIFKANEYYLESMRAWRQLMENPRYDYLNNDLFRRDFMDFVDKYRHVTTKLDDSERGDLYPEDFPFAPVVRHEFAQMRTVESLHAALEYLRRCYENGNYDEAAERSPLLIQAWHGLMQGYEYLPHVPVPEYKDEVVEAYAIYVNALKKTGGEFAPNAPLIDFINKVMYYDPMTQAALRKTSQIDWAIPEGDLTNADVLAKYETLLEQLRDAAFDWNLVVTQFPILTLPVTAYVDPSSNLFSTAHLRECRENQIGLINDTYMNISRQLNRPITTDYPLHAMLPEGIVVAAHTVATPQETASQEQPPQQNQEAVAPEEQQEQPPQETDATHVAPEADVNETGDTFPADQ